MALISAQNLHVEGRITGVSFSVARGEMLGIIGPNGSGKSTLLHALAGLLPYQGQVRFNEQAIESMSARHRAQSIGLLPQSCDSAWSLTAADIVTLGRLPWNDQDATAIQAAIDHAGIAALLSRKVDQLSGGERARVWLARVLAGCPSLLLADEPIASLDLFYQRSVMQMLRQYAHSQQAVILALHDLALAARYCDKLCLMQHGKIFAWGSPAEVLTASNLSEVFRVQVHVDLDAKPPIIALM